LSRKPAQQAGDGFFARAYAVVAQVPPGSVVTYGRIAALIGNARAAQAVGWAMRVCPDELPSHRVVPATGSLSLGLFGGAEAWRQLLEDEGVPFAHDGRVDVKQCLWP